MLFLAKKLLRYPSPEYDRTYISIVWMRGESIEKWRITTGCCQRRQGYHAAALLAHAALAICVDPTTLT